MNNRNYTYNFELYRNKNEIKKVKLQKTTKKSPRNPSDKIKVKKVQEKRKRKYTKKKIEYNSTIPSKQRQRWWEGEQSGKL